MEKRIVGNKKGIDNWVIIVIVVLAALLIANLLVSGTIFASLGALQTEPLYLAAQDAGGGTGSNPGPYCAPILGPGPGGAGEFGRTSVGEEWFQRCDCSNQPINDGSCQMTGPNGDINQSFRLSRTWRSFVIFGGTDVFGKMCKPGESPVADNCYGCRDIACNTGQGSVDETATTPPVSEECGNGVAEGGEQCGEPGLSCIGTFGLPPLNYHYECNDCYCTTVHD
jgi:hypothetical protein